MADNPRLPADFSGHIWGDENVADALEKLIPFLLLAFHKPLIFKSEKISGIKTGS